MFGAGYEDFLHFSLGLSLLHWVNDGLMVIFFFLIGLEVKKELVIGHLSTRAQLMLPLSGAIGGMVLPGLIFVGLTTVMVSPGGDESPLRGWAIPTATDIAFALGVLRIAAKGVPPSLRIFLSALAIADDLGAIVIIALFYSSGVNVALLGAALPLLAFTFVLGRKNKLSPGLLMLIGGIVWACVLNSGVHATVAGVALALMIPASVDRHSLMIRLEHGIKPYVDYAILPIFALCNAGIPLDGFSLDLLVAPVTLGVGLGLFLGKQIGVWIGAHIPVWFSRNGALPAGATPRQFYGVCVLTGIGFTMSLFIAALAYSAHSVFSVEARIGVMLGSLLSVIWAVVVLGSARKSS